MNNRYKISPACLIGVVAFFLTGGELCAQETISPLIKTGLIHKFAQHINWQEEDGIDTFRIGVYGEEPGLMGHIMLLESFTLKERPISVRKFTQLENISGIHLLYFTRDHNNEIQKIAGQIAGQPILMVSDRVRNQNLIMINLLPQVEGKADFEVNKANITEAGLSVAPDLLLLGGTEVDVVGLFRQSQKAMVRFRNQIDELSESFNTKSKQIESLNQEIKERNREINEQSAELETQKELYARQMEQQKQQQNEMEARAEELAKVLAEVDVNQQTLDSKTELILQQEEDISNQRSEIENRNRILQEQEDAIKSQEKEIEDQRSQLSNFANTVARQRLFLYIIIAVCFLIGGMVFFIYRGYRIKKEANLEIQQANEEVVATNEALEEQKKELQFTLENLRLAQSQLIQSEKMASVGVLTAGIAHELNNPINFVSGNVNPLKRDMDEIFSVIDKYDAIIRNNKLEDIFGEVNTLKTQMDYSFLVREIANLLDGITEGANRSSQIVKGLRIFSRLDEDKCQVYDIHEGIESSLILLRNKMKNRITVHKDYDEFEEVECFPSKLNQVFMNILTNSLQAIEDKGEIFIQTKSSSTGIRITIKDNGRGMTPEVKDHIFEPFYTTKDVGQGTGLGLSISFGIIEQHNGHIDVNSSPGEGTEFIISLPKTQSE